MILPTQLLGELQKWQRTMDFVLCASGRECTVDWRGWPVWQSMWLDYEDRSFPTGPLSVLFSALAPLPEAGVE